MDINCLPCSGYAILSVHQIINDPLPEFATQGILLVAINDSAKAEAFWNSDLIKQRRADSGVVGEVKRHQGSNAEQKIFFALARKTGRLYIIAIDSMVIEQRFDDDF